MSLKDLFKTKNDTDREREFTELYGRTFNKVYGFLEARLSGNSDAAADLTQETFLSVYRAMGSFAGKSADSTWVLGIAKNKLYDYYRLLFRQKEQFEPLDDAETAGDSFDDPLLSRENARIVREVLGSLPEQYRMLLILKYLDNCKMREIASLTGRTVKSVDGLIQRAKSAFIKAYSQYGFGGRNNEK